MGGLFLLLGNLLKTKQTPLPIIKIRRAIRVGAFQVHKIFCRRLLHRLPQNRRKSKIPTSSNPVKLNKWIQRICASLLKGGTFSMSEATIPVAKAVIPGNANLPIGASQSANREIGVPGRKVFAHFASTPPV
jgi:hypothetical protein